MSSQAGGLKLVGVDHYYIEFYPDGYGSGGDNTLGRKGYIGYPGANDNDIKIHNSIGGITLSGNTNVLGALNATDRVSIGTATQSSLSKLHIKGTTNSSHFFLDGSEDTYIRGGKDNSNVYINGDVPNGKVGVGTNTPGAKLHVRSQFSQTTTTSNKDHTQEVLILESEYASDFANNEHTGGSGLTFKLRNTPLNDTSVSYGKINLIGRTGANTPWNATNPAEDENRAALQFMVTNTNTTPQERMRIDYNGNIGMGTTVPIAPLHIHSSRDDEDTPLRLLLLEGHSNQDFNSNNDGACYIEMITKNGTQNWYPSAKIQLSCAAGDADSTTAEEVNADIAFWLTDGTGYNSNYTDLGNQEYDDPQLLGVSKERMRIKWNGNVGIGTSTPKVVLDISGNDAIKIPSGTTNQRPSGSNVEAGQLRYNTDLGIFEGYTNTWAPLASGGDGGGGSWNLNSDNYTTGKLAIGKVNENSDKNLEVVGTGKVSGAFEVGGSLTITGQLKAEGTGEALIKSTDLNLGPSASPGNKRALVSASEESTLILNYGAASDFTNVDIRGITTLRNNLIVKCGTSNGLQISQGTTSNEVKIHYNGTGADPKITLTSSIMQIDSPTLNIVTPTETRVTGNTHIMGNVGIGTEAPDKKLDVRGDVRIGDGETAEQDIEFLSKNGNWQVGTDNKGNGTHGNHFYIFDTNSSGEKYSLTVQKGTGRVGIGTKSPQHKLDVSGTSRLNGNVDLNGIKVLDNGNTTYKRIEIKGGNSTGYIYGAYNNTGLGDGIHIGYNSHIEDGSSTWQHPKPEAMSNRLSFGYNKIGFYQGEAGQPTTEPRLIIDEDGNVGIGTEAPDKKLDVRGDVRIGDGETAEQDIEFLSKNGNWQVGTDNKGNGTHGNHFYIFDTNSSGEKYSLTVQKGTGRVGIGTKSPQHKLDVSGTSRLNGNVDLNGIKVLDNGNTTYKRIEIKGGNSTGYIYGAYNNTGLGDGIHIGYNSHIEDGSSTWQHPKPEAMSNRLSFGYNKIGFYQGEAGQPTTEPRLIIDEDGNVGIGTEAPDKKLDVRGDVRIGDGETAEQDIEFLSKNGNWQVGTDNKGNGTHGNHFYIFDTNSSGEKYSLTVQKGTGRVGIGTKSPQHKLDVSGTSRLNGNVDLNGIKVLDNGNTTYKRIEIKGGNSTGYIYGAYNNTGLGDGIHIGYNSHIEDGSSTWQHPKPEAMSNRLSFGYNKIGFYQGEAGQPTTEPRLIIDEDGNVGIGTEAPDKKLDVRGDVRIGDGETAEQDIEFLSKNGNWQVGTDNKGNGTHGNHFYIFDTNSSGEKYSLTVQKGTGRVGIGTKSPQHKLDVSGTSRLNGNVDLNGIKVLDNGNTTYKRIEIKGGNSTGYIYGAYNNTGLGDGIHIGYNSHIEDGSSTWQHPKPEAMSNRLSFGYNKIGFYQGEAGQPTTEPRLIIDEDGNVGIGTEAPDKKLDVRGDVRIGDGETAEQDIEFLSKNGNWQVGTDNKGNGTHGNHFYIFDTNSSGEKYSLTVQKGTGRVGIGTKSPQHKLDVSGTSRLNGNVDLNGIKVLDNGNTTYKRIEIKGGNSTGYIYGAYNNTGLGDGIHIGYNSHIEDGSSTWQHPKPEAMSNRLSFGYNKIGFYQGEAGQPTTEPRLIIDEDGNVGIGTEAPDKKLDVRGDVRIGDGETAEQDIEFLSKNGNWQVGTNNEGNGTNGNHFYIYDKNSSKYSLTVQKETGHVGIGTTSPGKKLDVDGTFRVTGATTLSSTLSVASNLNVNGDILLQAGKKFHIGGNNNNTPTPSDDNTIFLIAGVHNSTPTTGTMFAIKGYDNDNSSQKVIRYVGENGNNDYYFQPKHSSNSDGGLHYFRGKVAIGTESTTEKFKVNGTGSFTQLMTNAGDKYNNLEGHLRVANNLTNAHFRFGSPTSATTNTGPQGDYTDSPIALLRENTPNDPKLIINYGSQFPGGTQINSALQVTGDSNINGIKILDNGNTSYKRIEINGGNSTGYIYGAYNGPNGAYLGDGLHIGYNSYVEDGSSTWQIKADTVNTNRLSFSYNEIGFYQGEPGQPTTEPRLIINEQGKVNITKDTTIKGNVTIGSNETGVDERDINFRCETGNWEVGTNDKGWDGANYTSNQFYIYNGEYRLRVHNDGTVAIRDNMTIGNQTKRAGLSVSSSFTSTQSASYYLDVPFEPDSTRYLPWYVAGAGQRALGIYSQEPIWTDSYYYISSDRRIKTNKRMCLMN